MNALFSNDIFINYILFNTFNFVLKSGLRASNQIDKWKNFQS